MTKCDLEDGSENSVKLDGVYLSMAEFTFKEVAVFSVTIFGMKHPSKYYFLGIYEIFNISNNTDLDCQMWFQ